MKSGEYLMVLGQRR